MATKDSRVALLDRIADEFTERYRRGERPELQEYIERYPELAEEIREYLPAIMAMEFVEAERDVQTAPRTTPAPPLLEIGNYAVLREIGRGGMGVVYEAEQRSLGRHVALKILPANSSKDVKALERFRREARAAAKLHHTNIVPVFEVGQDGDTCFYAMQYIQGQPLDEVIDELRRPRATPNGEPVGAATQSLWSGNLDFDVASLTQSAGARTPGSSSSASPKATGTAALPGDAAISSSAQNRQPYFRSVAQIGHQVAQALAYAHGRGIIHRDIKPSNLLLDAAGIVWVSDFGLAKTDEDGLTRTGDLLGTFRYMSPERFHGECDARADVYSLGLTLYEMLTLTPAFSASNQAKLVEQIQSHEPPRPLAIDAEIPRDLETIVLKAIEKEPARRYASAEEMAYDLRRFLDDEPIHARRIGYTERLWRWCRRNRQVVTLSGVVFVLLMMVGFGLPVGLLLHAERDRALAAEDVAQKLLTRAQKAEGEARAAEQENRVRAHLARAAAYRHSRRSGQRFQSLAEITKAMELKPGPDLVNELRNEAVAALMLPDLKVAQEWDGAPDGTDVRAVDATFEHYAFVDEKGYVRIRRLGDHREIVQLRGGGRPHGIGDLEFSPDGRLFRHRLHTPQGLRTRIWRIDQPKPKLLLEDNHNTGSFRPDSLFYAAGYANGTIRVIDLKTGKETRRFESALPPGAGVVVWNPRYPKLVATAEQNLWIVDLETGQRVTELHLASSFGFVDWHPEGRLLVATSRDFKLRIYDTITNQQVGPLFEGHRTEGIIVRFSHGGDRIASNDWSGQLRLWDARTGKQLLSIPAAGAVLQFSPDDKFLAGDFSAAKARYFRCWTGKGFTTVPSPMASNCEYKIPIQTLSKDGRLVALHGSTDYQIALVDVARGEEVGRLPIHGLPISNDPTGNGLWSFSAQNLIRWPLVSDPKRPHHYQIGPPSFVAKIGQISRPSTNADARVFAIPNFDQGALVWRRDDNRVLSTGPQVDVRFSAVSPDGRWIATGSHTEGKSAGAKVWESATGTLVRDWPLGGWCIVGFSANGKWLVTTGGGPRLWEVGTWKEMPLPASAFSDRYFVFSADSKTLALSDAAPGVVRLIAPETGQEFLRISTPELSRLAPGTFALDGTRLVTVGLDSSSIHVIDLQAIREELVELDLDWDGPRLPAVTSKRFEPIQIDIDSTGPAAPPGQALQLVKKFTQFCSEKKYVEALRALRQAVDTEPTHARARNELAWFLCVGPKELRNPKEALAAARAAIELDKQPTYFNTLGVALYRNGEFKEAIPVLDKSLTMSRGSSDAFDLYFLAMCHHRLGDAGKAADCFERAQRWVKERQGKLSQDWLVELKDFEAEAKKLLAQPTGPLNNPK